MNKIMQCLKGRFANDEIGRTKPKLYTIYMSASDYNYSCALIIFSLRVQKKIDVSTINSFAIDILQNCSKH